MESIEHVMVVSAMSRLARCGGWARLLEGKPLEDETDLVDAELLERAGVLRHRGDGTLEPVESHPWCLDPATLASSTTALLRRALHHAEGRADEWYEQDLETWQEQGLSSRATASTLAEGLVPQMAGLLERLESGHGRMLDVGVGVGGLAVTMCQEFPGLRVVGIDVLEPVLREAERTVAAVGLADRVELRRQSVDDLDDDGCFDLAWLPQAFIPHHVFLDALAPVHEALCPGGWVVSLLAAPGADATPLERAVREHGSHLTGGGLLPPEEVVAHLQAVGFTSVRVVDSGLGVLVLARREPAASPPSCQAG